MMQRRSMHSLLLTSFILVFAFTSVSAQQVLISDGTYLRGETGVEDITVDSPDDVGGFEILFEVGTSLNDAYFTALSVDWDADFDVLNHRFIDLSGVDLTSPDVIRMAAFLADDMDMPLASGQTVVAQLNFTLNGSCGGTIDANGTSYEVGNTCDNPVCATTAMTQFVDVDGLTKTPASLSGTVVTIENADPTIDPIADQLVHWGTLMSIQAVADDADLAFGYEVLEYSVVGPAGIDINSSTGMITWTPSAQQMVDACQYDVEVTVTDSCGASASTSFVVYLWNDEPSITCPTEVNNILWGYEASGTVDGSDDVTPPDPGPLPLTYFVASFDGPGGIGAIDIDPANGDWTWQTAEDPAYLGDFELCIGVTDGAAIGCDGGTNPNNADTCCLAIHVVSTADIVIEKTHDAYQGQHDYVNIYVQDGLMPMGGFDLLIAYDASAIALMSVEEGELYDMCGWELFEYRMGAYGNCDGGCPSGMVRIVGIAESNNGPNHPSCFGGETLDPVSLAVMDFFVTDDRTFECQYVPIEFFWYDCGDNGVSSVSGDTLFIDRRVFNYDTEVEYLIWDEEDEVNFPETDRLPNVGAPDECMVNEEGKPLPVRALDFWNGGIDIICADSIDARGDVNLNGVPNEIADAVLFSNYFVQGLGVFTVNTQGQIAATDVNADGLTLSVADLVYLVRIILGDAAAYTKTAPVAAKYYDYNGTLSVGSSAMGAAYVVASGNVVPELMADQMEMLYNFDGENTHVLIWSLDGNSFTGNFMAIDGEIISIELATPEGYPVNAKLIPTTFALDQNYPNPFNPSTTISFSLPKATDYTLTVYNIAGQVVAEFDGSAQAGTHSVIWDAANNASGVYFYRLNTNDFSDTKKMVLLK